jgi:hypothetical protein
VNGTQLKHRPDFIVIGAAKSGTTTLFGHLERHPDIYLSPIKEPSFFSYHADRERFRGWRRMVERFGDSNLGAAEEGPDAWLAYRRAYESLFEGASDGQLRGEASTNYTRWPQYPGVAERIRRLVPDVRLIYIMRHPVDRAYSHYAHRVTKELPTNHAPPISFEDYLKQDDTVIASSRYIVQIEQYLSHFPREALHLLFLDELRASPPSIMAGVYSFLGVDPTREKASDLDGLRLNDGERDRRNMATSTVVAPIRKLRAARAAWRLIPKGVRDRIYSSIANSQSSLRATQTLTPPPMRPETRSELLRLFRDDTRRLSDFLGIDLSDWEK